MKPLPSAVCPDRRGCLCIVYRVTGEQLRGTVEVACHTESMEALTALFSVSGMDAACLRMLAGPLHAAAHDRHPVRLHAFAAAARDLFRHVSQTLGAGYPGRHGQTDPSVAEAGTEADPLCRDLLAATRALRHAACLRPRSAIRYPANLEAVEADPRYWRFLPGAATETRLDEAGIERVFRVCAHHDLALVVIDTLEDLQPDNANLNDGASARAILRPLMARCQETGVAALVLRHEGKFIRRSGVHVGAGSIQLIAALRATFLLVQRQDEDNRLLPERRLVPAKVNVSCPRSISLSLENVTRALPDFDGDLVDQLIPVAASGELGDLTADDIIHGDDADHAGEADSPERLLEAWLQDGPVRKRDLLKSAREAGFAVRTLERAAKKLGVVRSLLEQDHTPRNNWPVVWCLPDVSDRESDIGQSGSSRPDDDAP